MAKKNEDEGEPKLTPQEMARDWLDALLASPERACGTCGPGGKIIIKPIPGREEEEKQ